MGLQREQPHGEHHPLERRLAETGSLERPSKEIARDAWILLSRRERWRALALLGLTIVAAAAEALGIGLVFPIIGLLSDPAMLANQPMLQSLFDWSGAATVERFVLMGALLLIAVYAIKNVYLAWLYWFQARFVSHLEARLGSDLLRAYLHAPYASRLTRNSAEQLRIVTGEVNRATSGFLLPLLNVVTEGLVILAIALLLFWIEPVTTSAVLLLIGLAGLGLLAVFKRRLAAERDERVRSNTLMYRWVSQGLGALKEIKVLGREAFFVNAFSSNSRRYAHATATFSAINLMPRLAIETLAVSALLGVVAIGLASSQPMENLVPLLMLFGLAAVRIMPSATRLIGGANNLRYYAPALHAVARDLRLVNAHDDPISTDRIAPENGPPAQIAEIELRNVSYRYPGALEPSLRNLNLRIRAGEMVAIVGRSGSGKTTLADLLLGLLSPDEGEILINGRTVSSLPGIWRGVAGLVPQHFFLLDASIRSNVAFGLPVDAIDDGRVWRALELARLDGKVRVLPRGLDAEVGEHGSQLSGGERQRLSIARALYDDPHILVFDEAMSALDMTTEAELMETLNALAGRKTLILITHRLASIAGCNRVLLMREGQLAADGTYDDLAQTPEFGDLIRDGSRVAAGAGV